MSQTLASSPHKQSVTLNEAADLLRSHQSILIVSHLRPDGDCLGSTVGLLLGLRALGKKVSAYNCGPIGPKWEFLRGIHNVALEEPAEAPSLTVFVDCGAVYRVREDFQPRGVTLNIDHHLTNERFGDYNFIDIDSCAVGEQIHDILKNLGVEITPEIASALYLSVLTDTGGFRYSNTTSRAFRIAGSLVDAGAEPGAISQAVYESRNRGEVLLSAKAMLNVQFEAEGKLAWAELRWADYAVAGGKDSEPEGLVGEIRAIDGVEVSCLLHETETGLLRAGFRGKGAVDCSAIAQRCGGGGHYNASGANLKLPYEEAKAKVLAELRRGVAEAFAKS